MTARPLSWPRPHGANQDGEQECGTPGAGNGVYQGRCRQDPNQRPDIDELTERGARHGNGTDQDHKASGWKTAGASQEVDWERQHQGRHHVSAQPRHGRKLSALMTGRTFWDVRQGQGRLRVGEDREVAQEERGERGDTSDTEDERPLIDKRARI